MRTIDLIASFELEINKIDNIVEKPNTDDSLYWLNQGIVKFTKDRFNGNAPKRTSYEQNEKRTRDLINLLEEVEIDPEWEDEDVSYNSYNYTYPDDLMFVLNEDVVISDNDDQHPMNVSVFECTADNFMYRVNNSLTDFHYRYHRARPLRVRSTNNNGQNAFRLLTDKNYKISKYSLGYIRIPEELTNEDPTHECSDFPEYIWPEIVKIAAQMYVENKGDKRYQTLANEVLTQE